MSWSWNPLISGIFGLGQQYFANQFNRESMELQNQFNREMSSEQMKFNAEQAQLNRDFQERYFQDYQSIPAQVQQMKEAGINPSLMYGSAPSPGGTASGSAASASLPSSASAFPFQMADISALVDTISKVKDIELKDAQAKDILGKLQPTIDRINAEIASMLSSKAFTDVQKEMYRDVQIATIHSLEASARKSDSDVKVNDSLYELNLSKNDLEQAKLITEQFIQEQYQDVARLNALEEDYKVLSNQSAALDVQMKAIDAIYKSDQVEALTKKLMQEANISEKNARWFAVRQVTDIVFSIGKLVSSFMP